MLSWSPGSRDSAVNIFFMIFLFLSSVLFYCNLLSPFFFTMLFCNDKHLQKLVISPFLYYIPGHKRWSYFSLRSLAGIRGCKGCVCLWSVSGMRIATFTNVAKSCLHQGGLSPFNSSQIWVIMLEKENSAWGRAVPGQMWNSGPHIQMFSLLTLA